MPMRQLGLSFLKEKNQDVAVPFFSIAQKLVVLKENERIEQEMQLWQPNSAALEKT